MKEKGEKRKAYLEGLRSAKPEELEVKAQELTEQYFWLAVKHRAKQLTETGDLRKLKRSLARVKTVLREAELRKGATK